MTQLLVRYKNLGSYLWWATKTTFLFLFFCILLKLTLLVVEFTDNQTKRRSERLSRVESALQDLAREQNKPLPPDPVRNRILILHYLPSCPLSQIIKEIPDSFHVDLNEKLESFDALQRPSLAQINDVVMATALTLVRSTFLCENETSSRLLSSQERDRCTASKVRVIYARYFSVSSLNSIIRQFHTTIKIYVVPSDPRHHVTLLRHHTHLNQQQKNHYFKLLCHRMISDMDTINEQSMSQPQTFATVYHEIVLVKPVKIFNLIKSGLGIKDNTSTKREKNRFDPRKMSFELNNSYSWFGDQKNISQDYQLVDDACGEFYHRSIYRFLDDQMFFRHKGKKLPLKNIDEKE